MCAFHIRTERSIAALSGFRIYSTVRPRVTALLSNWRLMGTSPSSIPAARDFCNDLNATERTCGGGVSEEHALSERRQLGKRCLQAFSRFGVRRSRARGSISLAAV
jgi:hypothetical protein